MLANLDITAHSATTIPSAQKKDKFRKSNKKLKQRSREARPAPKSVEPVIPKVADKP